MTHFFLSVSMTVDEKDFCQICSSCNISKKYTHKKMNIWCDFLCDIFVKFVCCVLVETTQKCIFYVICHGTFCAFLYSWAMHYNYECCEWQNLLHIYAVCQYQIIVEIIIWTSVHNMYVFQCGLSAVTYMCTTQSGAICTECCT